MEKGTSSNEKNAEPPFQAVERAGPEARDAAHSRTPGKRNVKSQRRKQKKSIHQSSQSQWTSVRNSEQPSKKRLKTTNDSNESRRQRNLKNLMMINRLERNIGRMEARLQNLGFDLSSNGSVQASPPPPAESENMHSPSPSSSCDSQLDRLTKNDVCHGEQDPDIIYGDSAPSPLAAPPGSIDNGRSYRGAEDVMEGLLSGEFEGILLPRCILDSTDGKYLPALSHGGLEWMKRKSGIAPQLLSEQHCHVPLFGPSHNDFPRKTFCPLPSRDEASSLLYEYLQNFNRLCPLFEKTKLVSLLNQDNFEAALNTSAFWASANVVFALAIAFRIKDRSIAPSEHQRSWFFIKNAFSTFHDLCLGQPNIWSIQALLGMSIFFLGTMSAEPCCFLVTAAIRMSHEMGLGRREENLALSTEELQHRKDIFWIAYCLDREISLRFGKPPVQSDDDLSIDLPSESPSNSIRVLPSLCQHCDFDVFRAHCQLATIKGQLYKNLYSAAAKNQPLPEIMNTVGALDRMLQSWKDDLPSEYQPQSEPLPNLSSPLISMMLLYLHCSYFNCIIAMHRLIACRKMNTAEDLVKACETSDLSLPLSCSTRMFKSESLCANAARASIRLIKYMPEGHISFVGILVHYPIVSLATLSSLIIRNPRNTSRSTDMNLMSQVETLLSSLVVSIPGQVIGQLKTYCANYRAAAEAAVQRTMQFCAT